MQRFVFIAILILSSCGNPASVTTPPSPQPLDLTIAKTINDLRGSLIEAKNLYAQHPSPAFQSALNKIIAGEQEAEATFQIYESSLRAGGTPDATTLANDTKRLLADTIALIGQFK